jgi:hypothetical protein
MTLHPIPLNFHIYEENFLSFLSVRAAITELPIYLDFIGHKWHSLSSS